MASSTDATAHANSGSSAPAVDTAQPLPDIHGSAARTRDTSLMSSPKSSTLDSRVQSPVHPDAAADQSRSRRVSSSTTATGKRSLDPSVRPASHQGDNAAKPWIGTFNFEEPARDDADAEKGSGSSPDSAREQEDEKKDPNLVEWDGPDDPDNPHNWPAWWRWLITAIYGCLTFAITFASSIWSSATMVTAEEFHVSQEVMLLGTALFVVGFAWGPIIFGPMSELYGRKWPLYIGYISFGIFNIPVAVAQNLQTIFVCRFFGGFFASAPLAIVAGAIADLHGPVERGYGLTVFSCATFVGPALAPVVGSFVTASYLGWRWIGWLLAILSLSLGVSTMFVVPETFAPRLLQQRAARLRRETRNWALHAALDEQAVSASDIAHRYLLRPVLMMVQEPILLLVTLYMSLIYGILYLFFEAFPIAFSEVRGLKPTIASLPFLSLLVGIFMGAMIVVLATRYRFAPVYHREGHVVPEERLVPMFVGGILLPAGLFWFAWTSHPGTNIWAQILPIAPAGAGVVTIFLQGLTYIVDVYVATANSAIAANTFVRSFVGGGFIMFATGMYHDLGVDWATSLLAFLALALYPAPLVFYFYGHKIRAWSKFAPS